jgi:hypothetical protein
MQRKLTQQSAPVWVRGFGVQIEMAHNHGHHGPLPAGYRPRPAAGYVLRYAPLPCASVQNPAIRSPKIANVHWHYLTPRRTALRVLFYFGFAQDFYQPSHGMKSTFTFFVGEPASEMELALHPCFP